MKSNNLPYDEHEVIHEIKHFLPAQAPLKDFIHHNTLHAFQDLNFHDALRKASKILGYNVSLSLDEYRAMFKAQRIKKDILEKTIINHKGPDDAQEWLKKMLDKEYPYPELPRIGSLRGHWKKAYQIDMDSLVHPILFRILCSYLDQGISMWGFPVWNKGFLVSIKDLERNSFTSFFKTKRAKDILLKGIVEVDPLLDILVGDKSLYKQYLYDQQFAHQGWSGIVSTIEDNPQTLLDHRKISLHDLIIFELLLEIDALENHFGGHWDPLGKKIKDKPDDMFSEVPKAELDEVLSFWQEAFEWTYYDQVLAGIISKKAITIRPEKKSFQAMFCIDDRECSLRRYLEKIDPMCETFGTPGFFGVEFFYKPEGGKFYTKLCPAPVTPKFLIKELDSKAKRKKDAHFTKHSHSLFSGWLISQTLGFWSAFKLFLTIFKPSMGPATSSSIKHMDKFSRITVENRNPKNRENNLQVGFKIDEMVQRVEGVLKSIGMVKDFAPIVYVIGHGSSSVNNPHYAAYDCGACSGRAGSVNARAFCQMANHPAVREILNWKGIVIPSETQFVGGLHDTTRDEITFYDCDSEHLLSENLMEHKKNENVFLGALDYNAKERSRRFMSIDTRLSPKKIHEKILKRSVSLFEPRPELNHATNALCIIGRRKLTKGLFLDRRSFLNSFDYRVDPEGTYLLNILKAAAPVCGGINLEYYFSRVDNQKLGAGTKLPHNVMGLIGVANGIDGDLRPGLPSQMIEVHDPVRLLIIVEHYPDVVLKTIQSSKETYEWFINEWIWLVAVNPETNKLSLFKEGKFTDYHPLTQSIEFTPDLMKLIESNEENFAVHLVQ